MQLQQTNFLKSLHKRAKVLLIFLFFWAILITGHLFYYTIWAREYYLEKGKTLSEKNGTIPATRGSIFNSDMIPLAWTERYYDLSIKPYSRNPIRHKRIFRALNKIFPEIKYVENNSEIVIKEDLSPNLQIKCIQLIKHFRELKITTRIARKQINSERIKKIVGITGEKNGVLYGISGLERKLNTRLKGQKGYFKVMVDRLGDWIPGTWEEKQKSIPGEDIIIECKVINDPNNPNNPNNE